MCMSVYGYTYVHTRGWVWSRSDSATPDGERGFPQRRLKIISPRTCFSFRSLLIL